MSAVVTWVLLLAMITTAERVFSQDKGDSVRYYDDGRKFLGVSGYFEVVDVGDIVVYRQPGIYKTANKEFHYFSQTLISPIYPLKQKYLKRVFRNPEQIKALREIVEKYQG
jgi:signal peptidase I